MGPHYLVKRPAGIAWFDHIADKRNEIRANLRVGQEIAMPKKVRSAWRLNAVRSESLAICRPAAAAISWRARSRCSSRASLPQIELAKPSALSFGNE
jgi:hypothetical protein